MVATTCMLLGLNPTRNPGHHGQECGCSIVAKALRQLGMKKPNEKGVAAIWAKHKDTLRRLL
jgi:hypothetical protein